MNSAKGCGKRAAGLALLPLVMLCLLGLAACGSAAPAEASASRSAPTSTIPTGTRAETLPQPQTEGQTEPLPEETEETQKEDPAMKLAVNGTELDILWEDNESVAALRALAADAPLTIEASPYGGFEQVGPIGQALPRNDAQTVTEPGDVVLYSGDQIVVFYGSNSWAYTRLGKIRGLDPAALRELLGKGAVTLTISVGP